MHLCIIRLCLSTGPSSLSENRSTLWLGCHQVLLLLWGLKLPLPGPRVEINVIICVEIEKVFDLSTGPSSLDENHCTLSESQKELHATITYCLILCNQIYFPTLPHHIWNNEPTDSGAMSLRKLAEARVRVMIFSRYRDIR